jgi:GNAT superfamily N-acetyltransferase
MATVGMETRRATPNDSDQVWPLVRDFAASYEPLPGAFEQSFLDLIGRPDTLVLVAEETAETAETVSRIVGYLLANVHGTFFANGPVAWVEEVMVDKSARGRGVGRDLMEAAEAWARAVPAAYVALASRRAGDFYRALGYEDSATYFRKTFVPPRA